MKELLIITASAVFIGSVLSAQKKSLAHESSKAILFLSRVFLSILFAISILSLLVLCIGIPEAGVPRRIICGVFGVLMLGYYIHLLMTWFSKK